MNDETFPNRYAIDIDQLVEKLVIELDKKEIDFSQFRKSAFETLIDPGKFAELLAIGQNDGRKMSLSEKLELQIFVHRAIEELDKTSRVGDRLELKQNISLALDKLRDKSPVPVDQCQKPLSLTDHNALHGISNNCLADIHTVSNAQQFELVESFPFADLSYSPADETFILSFDVTESFEDQLEISDAEIFESLQSLLDEIFFYDILEHAKKRKATLATLEDWNIKSGMDAVNRMISGKRAMINVMYRPDLGWVCFDRGNSYGTPPNFKGSGFAHIMDKRKWEIKNIKGIKTTSIRALLNDMVKLIATCQGHRKIQGNKVIISDGKQKVILRREMPRGLTIDENMKSEALKYRINEAREKYDLSKTKQLWVVTTYLIDDDYYKKKAQATGTGR